ncbi:hypothetical protein [Xanthovirga aplysinae]|uniref:hypothetical protein n=1 Tax=Xanthovirga aplysinae TaxID=2529853 RepID=UPI0012BCC349|nr:hypothetical protein [Xanthovirga aplysinae]MTI32276.1 hypothetical protein [Xanthovirga aplysinae]
MKYILLVALCALFSFNCYAQNLSTEQVEEYYQLFFDGGVKVEMQNWEKDSLELSSGHYYSFAENNAMNISSPNMILGFLIGKGLKIEEAWYRKNENSCGRMMVMVPSSLLIKASDDSQTDIFEKLGFKKSTNPSVGMCPYLVTHYIFE